MVNPSKENVLKLILGNSPLGAYYWHAIIKLRRYNEAGVRTFSWGHQRNARIETWRLVFL